MTQAELDTLKNKYFVRGDNTDWPTATLSTAAGNLAVGGIKARLPSMDASLQADLILFVDTLDPLI